MKPFLIFIFIFFIRQTVSYMHDSRVVGVKHTDFRVFSFFLFLTSHV